MTLKESSLLFKRMRDALVRGALFVTPIWLTLVVVSILYSLCETWLGAFTDTMVRLLVPADWLNWLGISNGHIPGLSLFTALLLLGALGTIASWHVGRQGLRLIDHLFLSIPGIKHIYSAVRKIIDAVGEPGKSRFQKVVLVTWPAKGCQTIGFVTNEVKEAGTDRLQYWVFIPTVPNPTAGFTMLVYADDVQHTNWTAEDGLKLAMSLGVIAPPPAGQS
jgi:uncharacterized membrane protein